MKGVFKILSEQNHEGAGGKELSIGIDLKVGGQDIPCPLTESCSSHEKLKTEAERIRKDLDRLLENAKSLFEGPSEGPSLREDMSVEEIWHALSQMEEMLFVEAFNGLHEQQRRGVAEYVLTQCNIFAGKAAVFSSRYNEASGHME
jgi:hypothetical protein